MYQAAVNLHTRYGDNAQSDQVKLSGATKYQAKFSVGLHTNLRWKSAQPNFSGPTKYQASPNQILVLVEVYNLLQPKGLFGGLDCLIAMKMRQMVSFCR